MKKCYSFGILVLLVAMVEVTGAAIGSTGGTEDFEGLSASDGDELTSLTMPAEWDIEDLDATAAVVCDTANGGGVLDTALYTTASGAGGKPVGTSNIALHVNRSIQENVLACKGPVISSRQCTYTFWLATPAAPTNAAVRVGIFFPDIGEGYTKGSASFSFIEDTRDIQSFVHNNIAEGSTVKVDIGSGVSDGDDYNVNEWLKCEMELTTSPSETGTLVYRFNGTEIANVTVAIDGTNILLNHQFVGFVFGKTFVADMYIDDVTVTTSSAIKEWYLF